MKSKEAKQLFEKYKLGTCTEKERNILERWYMIFDQKGADLSEEEIDLAASEVWHNLPIHDVPEKSLLRSIQSNFTKALASAAAVLVVVSAALYFIKDKDATLSTAIAIDVPPGGNKATLTLYDGRIIDLSDDKEGVVINAGTLAYSDGTDIAQIQDHATSATEKINTISTPAGGQYKVILPDGSMVWLNAASSISFPAVFALDKREVELKGEAYFDIAQQKSKSAENGKLPFIVYSSNQSVEVLGTQFNVNTYEDEHNAKTTLIEGSIKLNLHNNNQGQKYIILRPNQQGIISNNAENIQVTTVNPSSTIAWKEGVFRFDHASIYTVMRQLSRWYDIEVKYQKGIKYEPFYGEIKRSNNLSEVLKVLEIGGVRFDMEKIGERILITVKS